MNAFRNALNGSQAALGTFVKLPTVETVELMALAKFDFVVIDLEHSPISLETVSAMIAVGSARGVSVLVRVPDHTPSWIQRCLDLGADGVVVPHVDTVEEARAVGRAARFEPAGTRGMGPTGRAGSWGLEPFSDYMNTGDETVVIAQIESATGVAAAAEVVEEGLVDALFVGPVDLSVSLGEAVGSPTADAATASVLAASNAHSTPCGIAIGADPERARQLSEDGYAFVLVGNDASILGSGARSLAQEYLF
jgi:4-hydroxy-2-oxoheptanedioate aldolase